MTNRSQLQNKIDSLLAAEKLEEASRAISNYLSSNTNDISANVFSATLFIQLNQIEQSLNAYALSFENGLSDESQLLEYSTLLFKQGQFENCALVLERLIALFPNRAMLKSNLAYAYHLLGNQEKAIENCIAAIETDAKCIEAYCNLGTSLLSLNRLEESLEAFENGINLSPSYAKLHTGKGLVLQKDSRFTEAIDSHQRAISLDPLCVEAYCNLGIVQMQTMQSDLAVRNFQQACRISPHYIPAISNLQLGMQYLPGVSLGQLRSPVTYPYNDNEQSHLEVNSQSTETTKGCVKVGFVSADFYKHPVGYFLMGLFQVPRKQEYEFHCYANQSISDSVTVNLKNGTDSWTSVQGLSDADFAKKINSDGIDVLVDLSGHTSGNRLGVFARRAAPVQVSWLGYFASTNTEFMDYLILSTDQAPVGCESYYSEKLKRINCCQFAYTPPAHSIEIEKRKPYAEASIVFGCFNNVAKVNDDVISVWSQILNRVQGSLLVLKWKCFEDFSVCSRVLDRFRSYNVSESQLKLLGSSTHEEMLDQYNEIDIALDTFPFSGALTTCEALWMGVPVITMRQLRPVSRQSHSILKSMGLDLLSTSTPISYVNIAVELANDDSLRNSISRSLRNRILESSNTSQDALAEELEQFFTDQTIAQQD